MSDCMQPSFFIREKMKLLNYLVMLGVVVDISIHGFVELILAQMRQAPYETLYKKNI